MHVRDFFFVLMAPLPSWRARAFINPFYVILWLHIYMSFILHRMSVVSGVVYDGDFIYDTTIAFGPTYIRRTNEIDALSLGHILTTTCN